MPNKYLEMIGGNEIKFQTQSSQLKYDKNSRNIENIMCV